MLGYGHTSSCAGTHPRHNRDGRACRAVQKLWGLCLPASCYVKKKKINFCLTHCPLCFVTGIRTPSVSMTAGVDTVITISQWCKLVSVLSPAPQWSPIAQGEVGQLLGAPE